MQNKVSIYRDFGIQTVSAETAKPVNKSVAAQTLQSVPKVGSISTQTLQSVPKVGSTSTQTLQSVPKVGSTSTQTLQSLLEVGSTSTQTLQSLPVVGSTSTQTLQSLLEVGSTSTQTAPVSTQAEKLQTSSQENDVVKETESLQENKRAIDKLMPDLSKGSRATEAKPRNLNDKHDQIMLSSTSNSAIVAVSRNDNEEKDTLESTVNKSPTNDVCKTVLLDTTGSDDSVNNGAYTSQRTLPSDGQEPTASATKSTDGRGTIQVSCSNYWRNMSCRPLSFIFRSYILTAFFLFRLLMRMRY